MEAYSQISRETRQHKTEPRHKNFDDSFYTKNSGYRILNTTVMNDEPELVKTEILLLRIVTFTKGRDIFANNGLENRSIKYGMENMVPLLTKVYDPTYLHFDKRK